MRPHSGCSPCFNGQHAVVAQPRRSAPHDHVAVHERHALALVVARRAAEQKHCGQAERDRDDRRTEIALVFVLVQRQPRAGIVAIDQACIGLEVGKAGARRGRCWPAARMRVAWPATRCPTRDRPRRSDSRSGSETQPSGPQLVIATDMRNPPGVSMWRNGAAAVTCSSAASNALLVREREAAQQNGARHRANDRRRPRRATGPASTARDSPA